MLGSRSPATLVGVVAEDPPREPSMHDPRHHAGSEEPVAHAAQGFGQSGSQRCAGVNKGESLTNLKAS